MEEPGAVAPALWKALLEQKKVYPEGTLSLSS